MDTDFDVGSVVMLAGDCGETCPGESIGKDKGNMTGNRLISLSFIMVASSFVLQCRNLHHNFRIFPILAALYLFGISILLLIQTFQKNHTDRDQGIPDKKNLFTIAGTLSLVLIWVSFLNYIGFIVTSVVSLTALTLMLDSKRITFNRAVYTLAIHTVVVVIIWIIFYRILLVPLPAGYLM